MDPEAGFMLLKCRAARPAGMLILFPFRAGQVFRIPGRRATFCVLAGRIPDLFAGHF
jgi:hypothetical protein